jgi:response regulator RpfG family c-di-GMP phosphodiesterase
MYNNFFEQSAKRNEMEIHPTRKTNTETTGEQQQERVWHKCAEIPELQDFIESHPKYFEPLCQIENYDLDTFEHCIETFKIAKMKLEEIFEYGIIISDKITSENMVSIEEYLGACLLHDIGKIEIPKFIINSTISDEQWINIFMDNYTENPDNALLHHISAQERLHIPNELFITIHDNTDVVAEKKSKLNEFLNHHGVRMVKYIPIEYGKNQQLGENSFTEKDLQELDLMGISRKSPLLKIMQAHEKHSHDILFSKGMKKEAILAGLHHDYEGAYKKEGDNFPFTVSSFKISTLLSEFIKLADMKDALVRKRSYHEENSELQALFQILQNVRERKIHFFVAYLWISAEMHTLEKDREINTENLNETQSKYLRLIYSYLRKIRRVIDKHLELQQEQLSEAA